MGWRNAAEIFDRRFLGLTGELKSNDNEFHNEAGENGTNKVPRSTGGASGAPGKVEKKDGPVLNGHGLDRRADATIDETLGLTGGASGAPGETKKARGLNALLTITPEVLSSIGEDGWEKVELAVDSGATETVIAEDMILSAELREGNATRRGIQYEIANGHRIPNLGEKRFVGTSEEGIRRHITAQVCEVNKGLLSVRRMVQSGNTVVFNERGSYIEDNKTKERMYMQERNGMYMLQLWTKAERSSGF